MARTGYVDPVIATALNTITTLTNNTGGTPSSTLAAITAGASYAQADMVAVKNALASLATSLNNLVALVMASAHAPAQ